MTIRVFHASRVPAPARRPRALVAAARAALGARARQAGELNVIFSTRAEMRRLNRRYLSHDYDTDVIAFPYPPVPGGQAFGDVFISVYQASKQARALGHPLLAELLTLAVHGALHLTGYRDDTAAARKRMFARQDAVLRRLR